MGIAIDSDHPPLLHLATLICNEHADLCTKIRTALGYRYNEVRIYLEILRSSS